MEDEMDGACSTYGYMENAYTISVENPEAKIESGDVDVDEDNINVDLLKYLYNVKTWTGFIWLMIGTSC
jgi:hypothetical protein